MNLHSFERQVDDKIAARGFTYFENGNIFDVEYQENNTYSFLIEGTKNYEVTVKLDELGSILYSTCDCPYDMGDVCKHEVAAYYELLDILSVANQDDFKQSDKKPDLKEMLSHLSKEQLVDIIMDISRKDLMIRKKILFKYSKGEPSQEVDQSKALIDEIIRKYTGLEGFITYRNTSHFVGELEGILYRVRAEDDVLLALDIAGILLEKSIEAIEYSDDSDGSLGYLIDTTIEAIGEIAGETDNFDEQEKIFSEIIRLSESKVFDEWDDYRIELLSVCLELATVEVLRHKLTSTLESLLVKQTGDHYSKYKNEMVLKMLFDIQKIYGAQHEVRRFVETHLTYTFFREELIQQSIQEGNYQKALELAMGGEDQDKEYRGLVSKWKNSRYAAYKGLSMKDEQRSLGRELLLDGDMDYYQELKELAPGKEKALYEEIKQELKEARHHLGNSVYLLLIEEENDLDEMLEYVRKNPSEIEKYAAKLIADHKEEVIHLFEAKIKWAAESSSNRKQYQSVCAILHRFKEVAGQVHQQKLTNELAILYKRKPAFLDELGKVR